MKTRFWKMHGAGNDFILIDDRNTTFPCDDDARLRRMAGRRTGIGAEGVILLQPSETADIRMRFFNPDGREANLCGNGARCVARLAHQLGIGGMPLAIETGAGTIRTTVRTDGVEVEMPDPRHWRQPFAMTVGARRLICAVLNTGVPHAVLTADEARPWGPEPLAVLGPAIRFHAAFAAAGTNVDIYEREADGVLSVRTWERGVEGETLACGTGIVATALAAFRDGATQPPIRLRAASGDLLTVDFDPAPDGGAKRVRLAGPAEHVFEGWFDP